MKEQKITWEGKDIVFSTNNTGIVSKDCFAPFEAAGITRAKLLEFEHHSFSKGIVVKIGDKTVRFSHDFEDPSDKSPSTAPTNSKFLDKVQRAIDNAVNDEVRKAIMDSFPEEVEALKKRAEAKEAEKNAMVEKLKMLGVALTEKQLKTLGIAC